MDLFKEEPKTVHGILSNAQCQSEEIKLFLRLHKTLIFLSQEFKFILLLSKEVL